MGKLSHEPGKTGATRANVRRLRRWLREIMPVCASARPAQLAVLRTEHEADLPWAFAQAVVPAQQSIPIPLVQELRYNSLCTSSHGARRRLLQYILVLCLERSAGPRQRLVSS